MSFSVTSGNLETLANQSTTANNNVAGATTAADMIRASTAQQLANSKLKSAKDGDATLMRNLSA